MISHHVFDQLTLIELVWLFLVLHGLWRSASASARLTTAPPILPPRKRAKDPKPFQGRTRKPHRHPSPPLFPTEFPGASKEFSALQSEALQAQKMKEQTENDIPAEPTQATSRSPR